MVGRWGGGRDLNLVKEAGPQKTKASTYSSPGGLLPVHFLRPFWQTDLAEDLAEGSAAAAALARPESTSNEKKLQPFERYPEKNLMARERWVLGKEAGLKG